MSAVAKLYMKLTGAKSGLIAGESRVTQYEGQIEIDDWTWNLGFDSSAPAALKDVAVPSVFAFGKLMDRATTGMLMAMKNGETLRAEITLEEASQEHFGLIIDLLGVKILSYNMSAKDEGGGGSVDENWTLDYSAIKFFYAVDAKDGGRQIELVRPYWSSTDPPKAQNAAQTEIRKLAVKLSPDQLKSLWKELTDDLAKRSLRPGGVSEAADDE